MLIVVEGISGTGKTVLGRRLQAAGEGKILATVPSGALELVQHVEAAADVTTLAHFWMGLHYAFCRRVRPLLQRGEDVILVSYVYRTLASFTALGAEPLPRVLWGLLLKPAIVICLEADEEVRQRRILDRDGESPKSRLHAMVDARAREVRKNYRAFALPTIDTTALAMDEVEAEARSLIASARAARSAQEKPA